MARSCSPIAFNHITRALNAGIDLGYGAVHTNGVTDDEVPSIETKFDATTAPGLFDDTTFASYGAFAAYDTRDLVRGVVADLFDHTDPGRIAARFHNTLVAIGLEMVRAAEAVHGALPVVLTGGCFANPRLAEGLVRALAGREVYLHREVPPGDGGIALGQAVIADAIIQGRS